MKRSLTKTPILAAVALFFGAQALNAQASDPGTVATDAPTVELPDVEDEVRSLLPQDVQAPLPPLPLLPLPALAPSLPTEDDLAIPETAYKTETSLETAPRSSLGETYSEASVGAGLFSGVSAALSIYRPGSDPSFSMTFSHDSLDGFAFHDAGEGFSTRRTAVSGRVRGSSGDHSSWSVAASFEDKADGLQGQSLDFYGVSHRFLDVQGAYSRPLGPFTLRTMLDASSASRSLELAADDLSGVLGVQEVQAQPNLALDWDLGNLSLTLSGDYAFLGLLGLDSDDEPSDRYSQRIRTDLSADFELSPALELGASLGFASSSSVSTLVPFYLSADAGLGEYAALSLKGGLASDRSSLAAAWRENPYLDVGELLPDDARWFISSKLDLFPLSGLSARVGADWAMSVDGGGRLVPIEPTSSSSRALYTYEIEEYNTLTTSASLRWQLGGSPSSTGGAAIGVGWERDWLDSPVVGEAQRLTSDLEYREKNEAFGGDVSFAVGIADDGFDLPVINVNGFVRLSPGIRVVAEFRDIALAFKGTEGRVIYAPYLTTGFLASARVQISL